MRVALLLFAMAGTAHADVCSVDDIAARIERLTGRVVDATTFAVSAEQRGNTIVATVEVGGGTREVAAPSCDAALDAAALVIGMAAPEPPEPAADAVIRDIPTSIERTQQPESPPLLPLPTPAHVRWAMSLGAGLDSGGQETTALGVRWRRASYGIEFRGTRSADIVVTPLATATIWETSVTGLVCAHASVLLTCAVATVGLSFGSSDHLAGAHIGALPLFAIGARVEWEYPRDGFLAVRVAAEGALHAVTSHFDVNDMPVWTSRRLEGLASGAVVVRFP